MKTLSVVIALLCLSSTVLAHDIYSNLRDRDGHLCCGGQDCEPVEARVLPNGSYYLLIKYKIALAAPGQGIEKLVRNEIFKEIWNEIDRLDLGGSVPRFETAQSSSAA
jgi:hypothetical protein